MSLINIPLAALWYYLPAGPYGLIRFGIGWGIGLAVIFGAHQAFSAKRLKRLYNAYDRPDMDRSAAVNPQISTQASTLEAVPPSA
jgi:hypothetical protein